MSDRKYLGETQMAVKDSPFANYTPADWAMYYITRYGGINGDHHKAWVLDHASRALKGGQPVDLRLATWSDGYQEWRVYELSQTEEYWAWRRGDCDDGGEYIYDEGIAP